MAASKKIHLGPYFPFLATALIALPGLAMRLAGVHLSPPIATLVSGSAILAASFLLLWACEAAQADISQTLALAVVALIAVLPEYAVDMYFTWEAGQNPQGNYSHYAIANMTGANRLLVGVAWGVIAVVHWLRRRRSVRLTSERRLELTFLGMATLYAFIIPIKGSLDWYDGVALLGIFVWYIILASRRPTTEFEAEGPAETLIRLPKLQRRLATISLFFFSGLVILANAEPFCEGLVATGKLFHINEFLLVQWLAPLASETPEFILALVFTWRGHANMALGSLLSSKLNQWTLLVGMIPGVFALSQGSLTPPIPLGHMQMQEILLTAAQSLLAVVLLSGMRLSVPAAALLLVLFAGQLIMPSVIRAHPALSLGLSPEYVHPFFSALYVMGAVTLFLHHPEHVWRLFKGLRHLPSAPGRR